MATDKAKPKTQSISWADIPQDILEIIKAKCYSCTRVRFSAVCQSWRSCSNGNVPISHLPWPTTNFCHEPHFTGYKVYDPHERKAYNINFNIPHVPYHSRVLASKKGWLLVEDYNSVCTTLNLHNPFSRRSIPLPGLEYRIDSAVFSATHASPPDSTFFVSFCDNRGKIHIGYYKFSDEDWIWSTQVVAEGGKIQSMVHSEGILYFVFWDGTFGRFELVNKCATVFKGRCLSHSIRSIHLVESKGDVLLATALDGEDITRRALDGEDITRRRRSITFDFRWIISRLNKSDMTWDSERLEGRTLFLSDASFCVPAIDLAADLDGCVSYFYRCRFWRIYSLRDQWYKLPDSFEWKAVDVGEKNIWIEPPYIEN